MIDQPTHIVPLDLPLLIIDKSLEEKKLQLLIKQKMCITKQSNCSVLNINSR